MLGCVMQSAVGRGEADRADLMAGRTQRNDGNELLNFGLIVEMPDLVGLDWPRLTPSAAYQAAPAGARIDVIPAQGSPLLRAKDSAHIGTPACLRDQIDPDVGWIDMLPMSKGKPLDQTG